MFTRRRAEVKRKSIGVLHHRITIAPLRAALFAAPRLTIAPLSGSVLELTLQRRSTTW
jgi:hypothetical protein